MGWLLSVGSIQLWVSFAKEPYKRDDILQKRPIFDIAKLCVAHLSSTKRLLTLKSVREQNLIPT